MLSHRFRVTDPARRLLLYAAHALRVSWVWMLVRPLARVAGWLGWPAAPPVPEGATPGLLPIGLAPLDRESLPARLARASTPEFVGREIVCVAAEPDLDEPRYAALFTELQRGSGAKLLDLRGVRAVPVSLFKELARSWTAERSAIPRLGIVLDYERWAMLHAIGGSRLRSITRRGIEVEIFYELQLPCAVAAWFAGRAIEHPIPAILEWLRGTWRPSAGWTAVLDTTAMLIGAFSPRPIVPDQLLQLGALALARRGPEGATQAIKHVRAALSLLSKRPDRMHCHARRLFAAALHKRGDIEAALAHMTAAIGIAAQIGDRTEEAVALTDAAAWELQRDGFAEAEARCRAGLALLVAHEVPHVRASLHRQLAIALHAQDKNLDEAEHHATTALGLRWDPQSRLARADRELLARIRAARSPRPIRTRETTV